MLLILIFVATMLPQVTVPTPIIDVSNQIVSVGANAILKSGHQHTKRMADDQPICSICSNELGKNPVQWPTCSHLYHFSCIDRWRRGGGERNTRCPDCNSVDPNLVTNYQTEPDIQGGQTGSSQPVTVHIRCGRRVSGIMCNQVIVRQIQGGVAHISQDCPYHPSSGRTS
ncbi:hypothetical protein PGT21_029967 [Puccinia graminis f. sp. tritici]|uniref:RING-type domain-containing protein n=1 Tax=Puccinia graminis f. sp. tritici TaxID=56615 RepID=A0A5B0NBK2_PUCGR|nr:hypothetical protein PGTUg99_014028 [Puccinia graminis f. sp. tritici]KAA1104696.1 hypothetical protein PGT21_029967 [Puccinia graminis f. sp. tritici]